MKMLLGGSLLAVAISLFAVSPAGAAEFRTFVGCDDLAEEPVAAHVCTLGDFPGAYFESSVDTEYEVCVFFPSEEELCAQEQEAEAGVLYVNTITSESLGLHFVTWYVEGFEVGSWSFRLDLPPPPPTKPLTPAIVPTTAPAVTPAPAPAPGPSARCLKDKRLVGQLTAQLRHASTAKQKTKLKARLKHARSGAKQDC